MSPKSKRQMAWDLEDSYSDEQEDEQDEDLSFPETCLCLVCNAELGCPEDAKNHIDKYGHNNLEMVCSVSGFAEEFDHSYSIYISYKTLSKNDMKIDQIVEKDKVKEPPAWQKQLKLEFNLIFELEGETPEDAAKYFNIFLPKIEKSMIGNNQTGSMSLYQNIPLKLEIYEFIQASQKSYKCNCCNQESFSTVQELKDHMKQSDEKWQTKKGKKKLLGPCKFSEAQLYLYNISDENI